MRLWRNWTCTAHYNNAEHPGRMANFSQFQSNEGRSAFEEFFVASGPLQVNFFICSRVDQYPIRFNVRIPVTGPVQFERMILVLRRLGLPGKQELNQQLQLSEVFSSPLKPLHIAMELG